MKPKITFNNLLYNTSFETIHLDGTQNNVQHIFQQYTIWRKPKITFDNVSNIILYSEDNFPWKIIRFADPKIVFSKHISNDSTFGGNPKSRSITYIHLSQNRITHFMVRTLHVKWVILFCNRCNIILYLEDNFPRKIIRFADPKIVFNKHISNDSTFG
jgi:hypothetical protein